MSNKEEPPALTHEELQEIIKQNEKKSLAARNARTKRLKAEVEARKRKRRQ